MKKLIILLGLVAFNAQSAEPPQKNILGLKCFFKGLDPNIVNADHVHVNFSLYGHIIFMEEGVPSDGKPRMFYGAYIQQGRDDDETLQKNSIFVSQGKNVILGIYRPRNEEYKRYLGEGAFRLGLSFSRATPQWGEGPQKSYLYLKKTPEQVYDRGSYKEYNYRAILAVKYHDQTAPSYLKIGCTTRSIQTY